MLTTSEEGYVAFTPVTITHDFDLPNQAGVVGTISWTPAEPMHNGSKTVGGTVISTLDAAGALSQVIDATTDPGTTPPGVPYRIVIRITGQPTRTYYSPVPHDQGSTIDLAALLAWATTLSGGGSGSGFAYNPVVLTATAGVITPDATRGYGPHRYTATSDITLDDPDGGSDGQPLEVQVYASGADRLLTAAGSSLTIPAGTWWWGRLSYVSATTTWLLDDDSGGLSSGSGGSTGYDTVQDEGTARAQRGTLNFVGAGVTATDDSPNGRTVVTIPGGVGASGYALVRDEGTSLTARTDLNFVGGGVTATDNSGSARTDVTIPAGWASQPPVHAVGNSGASLNLDASSSSGYIKTITLTANCTFSLTGASAGVVAMLELYLTQDATGSRTAAWPAAVKWDGGSAPPLSTAAGAVDCIVLRSVTGGATWLANMAGKGYA